MKKQVTLSVTMLAVLLVTLLATVSLAWGAPPAQIDPTQQQQTVDAALNAIFTQTAQAQLQATPNMTQTIEAALFQALTATAEAAQPAAPPPAAPVSTDPITVNGYISEEKMVLLQNPRIQQVLADNYGIQLNFSIMPSLDQVTNAYLPGMDYLWPAGDDALARFEQTHGAPLAAAIIFRSPLVIYSWAEVADTLIAQDIVTQQNNTYYADLPALVRLAVAADTPWQSLGASFAPAAPNVNLICADPGVNEVGYVFYGLLAHLLAPGETVDTNTLDAVLPVLAAYYARQDQPRRVSSGLFLDYVNTGVSGAPLVVNYEGLLIEYARQNPSFSDRIANQMRIIYPQPTVYLNHPLIALTPGGERLIQALQDPAIQQIAWTEHGLRSGALTASSDPSRVPVDHLPATIDRVLPLPEFAVMQRIITTLHQ